MRKKIGADAKTVKNEIGKQNLAPLEELKRKKLIFSRLLIK
jgi:hypothetical protein